jgi:DNA mismatch repair protein MutS
MSSVMGSIRRRSHALTRALLRGFLVGLQSSTAGELACLAGACAELDVAASCAVCASERGHVRPDVLGGRDGSMLEARGLRHPVVEAQDREEAYVGNDVELSPGRPGVLLYGVNSSGKSCFMKSVGVAVVMAQAGMYVAADSMTLRPFEAIHTRIWNSDDISRGVSFFQNEILELRQILPAADGRSLVLGDEMCSGTEEESAVSIVGAGIRALHAAGCKYVFTSHFHRVAGLPGVLALRGLQVRVE